MRKLVFCLLGFPLALWAEGSPSKPIRMIVPFPAGAPADSFGRGLAEGMSNELGQPVIVENIGGVGAALGVDRGGGADRLPRSPSSTPKSAASLLSARRRRARS